MLDTPIASIKNLRVEFQTKDGPVVGVEDVSFDINGGETVCSCFDLAANSRASSKQTRLSLASSKIRSC